MPEPVRDVYQAALKHNLSLFLAHPEVHSALQRHAERFGVSGQEVAKAMIWFMQHRAQDQVKHLLLSETGSHNQATVAQLLGLIEGHIAPALLLNLPQASQVFAGLAGEFGIPSQQFEEYVYAYVYRNQECAVPLAASTLSRICAEALKEVLVEELIGRLRSTPLMAAELQRESAAGQLEDDPSFLEQTRQMMAQAEQYIEGLMRANHYQVLVSPYDMQQEPRQVQAIVSNTMQKLQQLETNPDDEAAQALQQQMRQIVRGGLDARRFTHRIVLEKGREATAAELENFLQKRAQGIAPLTRLKAALLSDEERPCYRHALVEREEGLAGVMPAYAAALSLLLRQLFFYPLEAQGLEELSQGEEAQLASQARQERLEADLLQKQREARSMGMLARLMPGRNQEEQAGLEAALQQLRQETKALFARKIDLIFWLRALRPMQEVLGEALSRYYFDTFYAFMENRQANRLAFSLQEFLTGPDSLKLQALLQETLQEAFPQGSTRLLGVVGTQEQAAQGMWQYLKDPRTRKELQSYGVEAMGEKHQHMAGALVEQLALLPEGQDPLRLALHASLNGFLELLARVELFFTERYEERVLLDTGSTAHCSLASYFKAKPRLLEDYGVELVGKAEDRAWTVEILNIYDSQARQVVSGTDALDPHSSIRAEVMGEIRQRFAVNRYQILSRLYPSRDKSPARKTAKTDQGLRWRP